MYDAMADAAMLSVLMSRNNYYYDPPGVIYSRSSEPGTAILWIGGVFTMLIVASALYLHVNE